ncbi:hypothetical protein PROVRETT_06352 [Providencia rettgeri DSM 1131]|nr:hypothetical protein PROVRETT_06352 [Providencia rettgeri DSM 1131]
MKRRGKLSLKGIYVNFFGIAKRKAIAFLFFRFNDLTKSSNH